MTADELNKVLESMKFKSSFKGSDEHHQFSFKENYIGRDGISLGKYELTKADSDFKLTIVENRESIYTGNFVNIILTVPDDKRFPVIINFDSQALQQGKGFDITFEAI